MIWKEAKPSTRMYLISALVLLVGLLGAVAIYVTAEQEEEAAVGYDLVGDQAHGIAPHSSKRYVHDLELYGGKAAVLSDKINRWFSELWQGTSLAFTVAFIASLISLGYFLAARQKAADERAGVGDDEGRADCD